MSAYLDEEDKDLLPAGVTVSHIMRASAIIDGYCGREIGVKPYTERIPLTDAQRGHLSYYPVIELTEIKGRPKTGLMDNFFGLPTFEPITDISSVDIDKSIGSVQCGSSPFGMPFSELEVTYTSGWDPIPDAVKVACGMLAAKLLTRPDSNVKSKKDFDFTVEYFGTGTITPEIADMLAPYKQVSMR